MANDNAFAFRGKTVSLTTSATPNTAQARQILKSDINPNKNDPPSVFRCINNGTADIWLVISNVQAEATAAAFPTAGTGTSIGTPQLGFRLKVGIVEVFTINWGAGGIWIGDVSSGTSQNYDLTPGEGL
jgi:hypothetical protein